VTALLRLALTSYDAEEVLLPGSVPGLRIAVFGPWFPIRAVEPEMFIGKMRAEMVEVARDQRSVRGYFRKGPADDAPILVRYGDSQEGVLEQPFDSRKVRPLPADCR
jgi:hypothetical protein